MVTLTGHTALVTGGASGTGLGITRALLAAGAAVVDRDDAHAADPHLWPITLVVDLAASSTTAEPDDQPFVAWRWTRQAGRRVLTAQPISGLAAMALLVPGSLSKRPAISQGVAEAHLYGPDRNRAVVETGRAVLAPGASPDEIGELLVESLPSGRMVLTTCREARRTLVDAQPFIGVLVA